MKRHAKAPTQTAIARLAAVPRALLALCATALLIALAIGASLAAAATEPTTTIDPATPAYTTAQVSGTINPNGGGAAFDYYIEYREAEPPNATGFKRIGEISAQEAQGNSPIPVSGELENLKPGTKYVSWLTPYFVSEGIEYHSAEVEFETLPVASPTATIQAPTAVTGTTAQLNGLVNPNAPKAAPVGDAAMEGAFQTSWHFECIAPPSCPNASGDPVPADDKDNPVSAALTGLQSNTTYTVALIASNAGGQSEDAEIAGQPVTFKTLTVAPGILNGPFSPRPDGTLLLTGYVNPKNAAVSDCHFEYSADLSFDRSVPCNSLPPTSNEPQTVRAPLSGLNPETTYNFRLVATSIGGTGQGEDDTFTTPAEEVEQSCPNEGAREGASAVLRECRAYEMVSPPDKDGSDVMTDPTRSRASTDGNALRFASLGAFGDAHGTGITTEYIAERGEESWTTHAITSLQDPDTFGNSIETFNSEFTYQFSDDLSTAAAVSITSLAPSNGNGDDAVNLYLRRDLLDPGPGTYELLSPAFQPISITKFDFSNWATFAGASEDFTHALFSSTLNLTEDAPAQTCPIPGRAICERRVYEFTDGQLRFVGRIPQSPAVTCSGAECVPFAGVSFPGYADGYTSYSMGTISPDGRRVFFTAKEEGKVQPEGNLYVREDGNTTTQLNVSEKASPGAPKPATFMGTDADGSQVFFLTETALTEDADSEGGLYRADLDKPIGERLTFLSPDLEPNDHAGGFGGRGNAIRLYGTSNDGSYAYFDAKNQLASGGPSVAVAGADNELFVSHSDHVTPIGPVVENDSTFNASEAAPGNGRQARVSVDGKSILFVSRASLVPTGDPSLNCENRLCPRVYLYSADPSGGPGSLTCLSCPLGGGPAADGAVTRNAATGGTGDGKSLSRAISDDGRLVFFSTAGRLVREDTNGRWDAYVYDTETGQPHLLSSGECNCDSYFLEASADGSDAFFATRERLVGWDVDGLNDVYDARVNGGLPEPPIPPPSCQGDACQPPPPALNDPTPASSGIVGGGNPQRAKPCPKGKHRRTSHRKSRCVTNRKHAARKHRADNKRRASR